MLVFSRNIVGVRGKLRSSLERMESNDPEILGSIVFRSDGLILASAIRSDINADLVAAMLSSILSISSRVTNELRVGDLENIVIKSKDSIIALVSVVSDIVLGAIAKSGANLGLLLLELSKCRDSIRRVISKL